MPLISDCFSKLRDRGRCALIPFIMAGDPDLATTAKALQVLDQNGADILELGIPYSDPLADGPVIQAAATRALGQGTRLDAVLAMVQEIRPQLQAPIVAFTYYNPILNQGIDPFLDKLVTAGINGLVVPDLPLEETPMLLEPALSRGIEMVLLVAPTSPLTRIQAITAQSQGFVYLVSVTGVTGVRVKLEERVRDLLLKIKETTDKPVGVGFGISQPEHARQVMDWGADAVIVGSAFVKRLVEGSPEQGLQAIGQFCRTLKRAIDEEGR